MTGTEETLEQKQDGGIVEKAFALPLVNATYDSLASLATPLQPYAEKTAAMMSSMGESYDAIKAGVQDKVPDVVTAKVTDAKGQVSAAVNSVDSSLCSGLDKLVDKVPALRQETPELYNSTKSSMGTYAFMATTYMASFTVVNYALKFSDFGIDGADSILKLLPGEKTAPLRSGLKRVQEEAAVVRQEGAKQSGSETVLALQNASLLELLAGLLKCCCYLFNLLGFSTAVDVPAKPVLTCTACACIGTPACKCSCTCNGTSVCTCPCKPAADVSPPMDNKAAATDAVKEIVNVAKGAEVNSGEKGKKNN